MLFHFHCNVISLGTSSTDITVSHIIIVNSTIIGEPTLGDHNGIIVTLLKSFDIFYIFDIF